ncbi:hypothetical protein Scel_30730 [Streptomyces cellostaticus]|nr:hypothetical protein Scel_30730 [Streptomyces cellostaticus]
MGDGGLGGPEPGGRGGEPALVGHGDQDPQLLRGKVDCCHSGAPTCVYEGGSWTVAFHEPNPLPGPGIPAYGPLS